MVVGRERPGLADGPEKGIRVPEAAGQVAPKLAHTVQHRRIAAVIPAVGGAEGIVVGLQLRGGGPLAAPETAQQGRITLKAPAQHQRKRRRVGDIRRGKQIAVIAQRQACVFLCPGEHLPVDGALIKLRAQAGVDNEQGDGIVIENIQQSGPLSGIVPADTGLDGDFHIRERIEDAVQQLSQQVAFPKQARPLVFARNGAGGAAQIQVHLTVATALALLGRPDKVFGPIC